MKCVSKICSALLALTLVCLAPATVYAHDVPGMNRTGTVTVKMESDGKAVTGGILTAYRVGEVREDDGDYSFAAVSGMERFISDNDVGFEGVFSEENLGSPELMSALAKYVAAEGFPACAEEKNENGRVVFTGVAPGLYLIVQTEASDGYKPILAFLISVPVYEDGTYVYDVNAEGKFEIESAPPTPDRPHKPDKPDESDEPGTPDTPTASDRPSESALPQTGQLNWPIPFMAGAGLCLLTAGCVLRRRQRGAAHEQE